MHKLKYHWLEVIATNFVERTCTPDATGDCSTFVVDLDLPILSLLVTEPRGGLEGSHSFDV